MTHMPYNLLLMALVAMSWPGAIMSAQEKRAEQSKLGYKGVARSCNLRAMNNEERKKYTLLRRKLRNVLMKKQELPNGYAFQLSPEGLSLSEIGEWISLELRCCPFFDFQLEVPHEKGPIWLRLTGREGVKQFIESEFQSWHATPQPETQRWLNSNTSNASPATQAGNCLASKEC